MTRKPEPEPEFDLELLAFKEPCWWRADIDYYGKLTVSAVKILKYTPKGVQVIGKRGVKALVLRKYQYRARAFCAPTREQAVEDFIKRKAFQIGRLQAELDRAMEHLSKADPEHHLLEGTIHHGKAPFSS